MMELAGRSRFVQLREETKKVNAASLIRVDGYAYLLARELAQQEIQLLIDDSKIVIARKACVIAELDKAGSVYKPRTQKENPRREKIPVLGELIDCTTNEMRKRPLNRQEQQYS